MKIAYISTYLPQRCGIATYTDYLVQGIRRVAPTLEVRVIAERGASSVTREKFEVIPCWGRNEDYVEPIITYLQGVEIAHIQHEYSIYKFDDRLPNLLARLNGTTKKILTIHCIRPSQFSERGTVDEDFAKRIAHLADEVIVHLESQRSLLLRLGIPSKRIHVIRHGTELSDVDKETSRKRFGLPGNARILLMFGFVKRHKCLHVVIEAVKEMVTTVENVCLFVAGGLAPKPSEEDRKYIDMVRDRVHELGLQDRVIFPNRFFPNEDVPYLFGASDVVLFPYYEEDRSASGSLHLAIGAKKPIIASRIPKFEELRNVCDELLVLPYNATAIAKIASRLFQDPEFELYVLDRIEEYREKTSWIAVAGDHLELYKGS